MGKLSDDLVELFKKHGEHKKLKVADLPTSVQRGLIRLKEKGVLVTEDVTVGQLLMWLPQKREKFAGGAWNPNEPSQAESPPETFQGTLVRVTRNPNSKSEHEGYALQLIVEMEQDNPFEHKTLEPLEGKVVRVSGRMYRGKLIGETIEIIGE